MVEVDRCPTLGEWMKRHGDELGICRSCRYRIGGGARRLSSAQSRLLATVVPGGFEQLALAYKAPRRMMSRRSHRGAAATFSDRLVYRT
jgi:hypothetical protein